MASGVGHTGDLPSTRAFVCIVHVYFNMIHNLNKRLNAD
jgi:hypothetical protein